MQEFIPLIDADARLLINYFRKNMIEEDMENNPMIQLSHDVSDNSKLGESRNSSYDTCQKMMVIDDFYLQRICFRIIFQDEQQLDHLHLIFENNPVCTYEEIDEISCQTNYLWFSKHSIHFHHY